MKDSKTLMRIGIVFLVALIIGWIIWLFVTGKAESFAEAITHVDPIWFAAGLACEVGYVILDALCFRIAGTLSGVRIGAADLTSIAATGIVFGYLTPGQMGAAPAQIVRLNRAGLSLGDASAVQLTRFFIYQAAVTIFGTIVVVARFAYFKEVFGDVVIVGGLAFLVHLGIMAMLVGLIFFPDVVRRIGTWGVGILGSKLHIIKDPDAALAELNAQVDEYSTSVHAAIRHVGIVVSAIVITTCQLCAIYTTPFCVLHALGVESVGLFETITEAAFIQLVLTAVPLPGGTGGAEGGFALFFKPVLGDLTSVGVVLWRAITFYLPVIFCAPLMGLKSKLTPDDRQETYGEAHVGREAIKDDISITRQKVRSRKQRKQARKQERLDRRAQRRSREKKQGRKRLRRRRRP